MAEVSISKALNVKTKLAGRVAHLQSLIGRHNSTLRDSKKHFDVLELAKEASEVSDKLAKVKTAIAEANAKAGIFSKIYQMAELKSRISFLRSLNTREGEEEVGFGERSKTVHYESVINTSAVESESKDYEDQIEQLQDEITFLNQTTKITIPD